MADLAQTMDQLSQRMIVSGVATSETIIGCTPGEVAELRADHRVERLPEQYEQFLLAMGKQSGRLLRGTDIFYPHNFRLDDDGRELLAENDVLHLLSGGSIIIGMHQGAELYWLEPGEPEWALNWYQEPDRTVHKRWPNLLEFLSALVNAIAQRSQH
ncbi:hypothetical protein ABZ863_07715 [Saccharomonospora sp. NPDC046836]|uniref:hypothetical protein n=1 Tax=Saccharomonospora sp. NPDC046836 TaxID=3156921 RepID=UPI0033D3A744